MSVILSGRYDMNGRQTGQRETASDLECGNGKESKG